MLDNKDIERIADEIEKRQGRGISKLKKWATFGGEIHMNKNLKHLYIGSKVPKKFLEPNSKRLRDLTKLGRY